MKKILHILPVAHPFSDWTVELFEKLHPGRNLYMTYPASDENLKKCRHAAWFQTIKSDVLSEVKEVLRRKQCFLCILHYVSNLSYPLLNRKNEISVPVVGIFWGGDLYFYRRLYTWDTLYYILRGKDRLKALLFQSSLFRHFYYRKALAALRQLEYGGELLDGDYQILQKDFPGRYHAEIFPFSYVADESFVLADKINSGVSRRDILVGNSAFVHNNHAGIYKRLAGFDLSGRKIISPLSYGDLMSAPLIHRAGKRFLGDAFLPIHHYLPLDEYHDILNRCGFAVFGGLRQMALGNIVFLFYQGCKLFFYRDSALYLSLKKSGFIVFSIEDDLRPENPSCFEALSDSEARSNLRLAQTFYSRETAYQKIRKMVDYFEHEPG